MTRDSSQKDWSFPRELLERGRIYAVLEFQGFRSSSEGLLIDHSRLKQLKIIEVGGLRFRITSAVGGDGDFTAGAEEICDHVRMDLCCNLEDRT